MLAKARTTSPGANGCGRELNTKITQGFGLPGAEATRFLELPVTEVCRRPVPTPCRSSNTVSVLKQSCPIDHSDLSPYLVRHSAIDEEGEVIRCYR